MIKQKYFPHQIIFDIETVPDLELARRVYPELQELAEQMRVIPSGRKITRLAPTEQEIDQAVLDGLYKIAGATKDDPRPFLKFFLQKVVSICGISRKTIRPTDENPLGLELSFFSIPNGDLSIPESDIIYKFLHGIGERKPQLIGWCSTLFDMPVLAQRALINRLILPKFCIRPDKPWEGPDYFSKGSDYNLDLMDLISSRSAFSKVTLNEFARANRIPGKIGVEGADVAELWLEGRHREIINYNECDTATTYLIWMEVLRMAGHITATDYEIEIEIFRQLLLNQITAGKDHLSLFITEWDLLQEKNLDEAEPSAESDDQGGKESEVDSDKPLEADIRKARLDQARRMISEG